MVDEAKGGKVSAEKRLADASGKVCMCMLERLHVYIPTWIPE